MVEQNSNKRRQFLSGLMKLLVFIGFVFLSIPFISSFSTDDIDNKQNSKSHWVIEKSILELTAGQVVRLSWSGGQVWVYARTDDDIVKLEKNSSDLRDVLSQQSDQPENMKNNFRSANKQFFIFIPQENKKGCQVSVNKEGDNTLFTEPCFQAQYDAAGRILKNTGHKEQQNLSVPNHVIEDGILKIGVWMPKI